MVSNNNMFANYVLCGKNNTGGIYMNKKGIYAIPILIVIIISVTSLYRNSVRNISEAEQIKIEELVNEYYNNIAQQKFETALSLLNYDSIGQHTPDLNIMNQNKNDYKVTKRIYKETWFYTPPNGFFPFDEGSSSFVVSVELESSYLGKSQDVIDYTYVKKVDGKYKIDKILTNDMFHTFRGIKTIYKRM